jgi:predicted Zn-dependent protease
MTKRGVRRLLVLVSSLTVVALLLGVAYLGRSAMNQRELERAREQGLALYKADEPEAALPHLGRYIARVKNDPEVLLAYGVSRRAVPMPNDAHLPRSISALRAAAQLSPQSIEVHDELMAAYAEAGYLTELVEVGGKLLELDPERTEAAALRITALLALNRAADAVAASESLVESLPDLLGSHQLYVRALREQGRDPGEVATYARSLQDRFNEDASYLGWSSALEWQAGNFDESERRARLAAEATPVSAEQVAALVDWLRTIERRYARPEAGADLAPDGVSPQRPLGVVADDLLTRTLNDGAFGAQLTVDAIRRSWWMGQRAEALGYAKRLEESGETLTGWARFVLAEQGSTNARPAADVSRPDESRIGLESESGEHPDWGVLIAARSLINASRFQEAAELLASANPEDSDTAPLHWYLRGLALRGVGDARAATLSLRDAAEYGGMDRDRAWKALGDTLAATGRFEESELAYARMTGPDAMPAMQRVDRLLSRSEQDRDIDLATQVINMLEGFETDGGTPAAVSARVARALVLAGEIDRGVHEAKQLLEADVPPDPIGLISLCRTLQELEPELVAELLATTGSRSDNVELVFARASTLAERGRPQEGHSLLKAAIDSRDATSSFPYRRALVRFADLYLPDEAIEAISSLSEDYPTSIAAQITALNTIGAWRDTKVAARALARLRDATGHESATWKVFNARLTLASDPSNAEISEALLALDEVLKESPDDFSALILAANAYEQVAEQRASEGSDAAEYIDLASGYYDRAVGESSRAFAFRPYVEMLVQYGRDTQANEVLDRFLAVREISPRARAQRVELLVAQRRWEDATSDQRWFALSGVPAAVLNMADLYARSGDRRRSAEVLEEFLADGNVEPEYRRQAAQVFAAIDEFDRAIEVLEELPLESDVGPRDRVAGDIFMEHSRPDLALPYLLAFARKTQLLDDWIRAIQASVAAQQTRSTAAILEEASTRHPDSPELDVFRDESPTRRFSAVMAASIPVDSPEELLDLRAIASEHARGSINDAELDDRLRGYSITNPSVYEAWRLRSAILIENGQVSSALDVIQMATESLPDDVRPLRELVRTLGALGQIDEALTRARELVRLSQPDAYEAVVLLARLESIRGNYNETRNRLETYRERMIRESAVEPTDALRIYILSLAAAGEADEVSLLLSDKVESSGDTWALLLLDAAEYLPLGMLDTKRVWIRRTQSPDLALRRAELWLHVGRYSGADSDFDAALSLADAFGTSSSGAWRWITAETKALRGERGEAERLYQSLIDEFPSNLAPRVGLASLLAHSPDTAARAVSLVEDTLALGPDVVGDMSADIVSWLRYHGAVAHQLLGRNQDAEATLEALLELNPSHLGAIVTLAELRLERGDAAGAREVLRGVRDADALTARLRTQYQAINAQLGGEQSP